MQRQHSSQATSTLGNTPNLNIGFLHQKENPTVSSLLAWWIFCLKRQNEMYDTQIQNELPFKGRENLQLTNTDKKPLPVPACHH